MPARWIRKLFRQPAPVGTPRSQSRGRRFWAEPLEDRSVPATFYVSQPGDFTITTDNNDPGLDAGDVVTWNPTNNLSVRPAEGNLLFGIYDPLNNPGQTQAAFATIPDALSVAGGGDTIYVTSGSYDVQQNLNVGVGVTFSGPNAGLAPANWTKAPATLSSSLGGGQDKSLITVQSAANVVVDGFAFQGSKGSAARGVGTGNDVGGAFAPSGLIVRNNTFADFNRAGVQLFPGATGAQVLNNTFTSMAGSSTGTSNSTGTTRFGVFDQSAGATITGNTITGVAVGVGFKSATPTSVGTNAINGGTVGYLVVDTPLTISGGSVGDITGPATAGVVLANKYALGGGKFATAAADRELTLSGLTVTAASGATGVLVSGVTADDADDVSLVLTSGTTISTSTFGANTVGLSVTGAEATLGATPSLGDTTFTGTGTDAKYIVLASGALDDEEIDGTAASYGVGPAGAVVASAALTVPQGFAVEDKITHALDDATLGFVRVKAGNVYVTPTSASVQRGIDEADDGDVVNIQSGTYTETVSTAGVEVTLAPGSTTTTAGGSSIGAVTLSGGLTLDGDDTVQIELSGTGAGQTSDTITAGTVTLDGASLVLENRVAGTTPDFTPSFAKQLTVVSGTSVVGEFGDAAAGSSQDVGNDKVFVNYTPPAAPTAVVLTAVPDAATGEANEFATTVYVNDDWADDTGTAEAENTDGTVYTITEFGGATVVLGYNGFATIQEGVSGADQAAASPNAVNVLDGSYEEEVTVDVPTVITGQSKAGVVVSPSGTDDNEDTAFDGTALNAFTVAADNVTISTLTIDGDPEDDASRNFRNGIITDNNAGAFDNLTVTDVNVFNVYRRGIQVYAGAAETSPTTGHTFTGVVVDGVTLRYGVALFDASATLSNVDVTDAGGGIQAEGFNDDGQTNPGTVTITGSDISGLVLSLDSGELDTRGIVLNGLAAGSSVANSTVNLTGVDATDQDIGVSVSYVAGAVGLSGVSVTGSAGDTGVLVVDTVVTLTGGTLTATDSTAAAGDNTGTGLAVVGAAAAVTSGGTNTITGFALGVDAAGGDLTLVASDAVRGATDVDGTGVGVRANGLSAVVSLTGTTLTGNDTGVRLEDGAAASLTGVQFYESTGDANNTDDLSLSASGAVTFGAGTVFAADRYFLDYANGDTLDLTADITAGDFQFLNAADAFATIDPQADTATSSDAFRFEDRVRHRADGDPARGLVLFNGQNVYVTAPGTDLDGLDSDADSVINNAIAAVPPTDDQTGTWTVTVEDGLYTQSVVVDRALTLVGQSKAGVVIAPEAEDTNEDDAYADAINAVTVAADGVTLRSFTIDGKANTALDPTGSDFRAGVINADGVTVNDLTVDNLLITNVFRRGIQVFGDGGRSEGISITGTTVSGVELYDAIALYDASGTVSDSTVENAPYGIRAETIDPDYAGTVSFTGNTVQSFAAAGGTGIVLAGVAGATVSGGTIDMTSDVTGLGDGTDLGIEVRSAAGAVAITGVTLNAGGADSGIYVFASGTADDPVTVSDNTLNVATGETGGTGLQVVGTDPVTTLPAPSYVVLGNNTIGDDDEGFAVGVSIDGTAGDPVTVDFATTGGNVIKKAPLFLRLSGAGALVANDDLGDTAFTGSVPASTFIVLADGAYAGEEVDATAVDFDGKVTDGTDVDAGYAVENQITHRLDDAGAGTGFVRVTAATVYVTRDSGSIQRGVDAAADGDTVVIQPNDTLVTAYTEDVDATGVSVTLSPDGAGRTGVVVIDGSLTLDGDNTLAFDVADATDYDQFVVSGLVTLGEATLELDTGTFEPGFAQTYTLIDGEVTTSGTFTGEDENGDPIALVNGERYTIDGFDYFVNYNYDGSDGDVVLTSVNNGTTDVVYVDDDFTEGDGVVVEDEVAPGVFEQRVVGFNAFDTIQEGLAAVDDAGTVQVRVGDYTGPLEITRAVTLAGDSKGDVTVTVASDTALTVAATPTDPVTGEVTVSGITFAGGGTAAGGVLVDGTDVAGAVTLGDNAFTGLTDYGVKFIGGATGAVTDSEFTGIGGFALESEGSTPEFSGNTVTGSEGGASYTGALTAGVTVSNNDLTVSGTGLLFDALTGASGSVTVSGGTGKAITVTGAGGVGVQVSDVDFTGGTTAGKVSMSDLSVTFTGSDNAGSVGVLLDGNAAVVEVGDTAGLITIDGFATGVSFAAGADAGSLTLTDVTISGSTTAGLTVSAGGVGGATATLTDVTLEDNAVGAIVGGGPGAGPRVLDLSEVSITGGETGLRVTGAAAKVNSGSTPDSLGDTEFSGQTGQYIELVDGAYADERIDGTGATFGTIEAGATLTTANGFVVEDKITHATDDDTVGLVVIRADSVFVTEDSGSIQRGVDAAAAGETTIDDVVYVDAGTYAETVDVLTGVTVRLEDDVTVTNLAGSGTGKVNVQDFSLTVTAAADTFAGVLESDADGELALTIEAGGYTLSGASSDFLGTVAVAAGALTVSSTGDLGGGQIELDESTSLTVAGTVGDVTGTGVGIGVDVQAGGTAGDVTITGDNGSVDVAADGTAGDVSVTGENADVDIAGEADSASVSGTGATLGISGDVIGDVSFGGATGTISGTVGDDVSQTTGTLTLDGASVTGDYDLVFGATLIGSGTIGGTLTNNGDVSPGLATAGDEFGTITVGAYTQDAAGELLVDASFDGAAVSTDQIAVTGVTGDTTPVELDGALTVTVLAGSDPFESLGALVFIDNQTGEPIGDEFDTVNGEDGAAGAEVEIDGETFIISYTAGDGNDVALVKAVEPGTLPVVYVNAAWAGLPDGTVVDTDPDTDGLQAGFIGQNAFASFADADTNLAASGTFDVFATADGTGTNNYGTLTLDGQEDVRLRAAGRNDNGTPTDPDDDYLEYFTVYVDGLTGGDNNTVDLNGNTLSLAPTGTTAAPNVFGGKLTGFGPSNLAVRSGGVQVLTNSGNDYRGSTTVAGGTLRVGGSGEVIPDQSPVTVTGTGVLDLAGKAETIGSLANGGTGAGGTVRLTTADNTARGVLYVGANNQDARFAGALAGRGSIVKVGMGTQTLALSNTSAPNIVGGNGMKAVSVYSGTLQFEQVNDIPTGSGTANDINVVSGKVAFAFTGTGNTVSRVITGGGGVLVNGTGTVTLAGANTYTGGTTVSSGTLAVADDSKLGTGGAVTLTGNGKLSVTGNTGTSRTFTLSPAAQIVVSASKTLTFNGATVSGGTLRGPGGYDTGFGSLGTSFSGVTIASGTTVNVTDAATGDDRTTFDGGSLNGALTIQKSAAVEMADYTVNAGGRLTIYGTSEVDGLTDLGYIEVSKQSGATTGGRLINVGSGAIVVGGGGTLNVGVTTAGSQSIAVGGTGGGPADREARGFVNIGSTAGQVGLIVQSGGTLRTNGLFGASNVTGNPVFDPVTGTVTFDAVSLVRRAGSVTRVGADGDIGPSLGTGVLNDPEGGAITQGGY